jgi:hypothetical protein
MSWYDWEINNKIDNEIVIKTPPKKPERTKIKIIKTNIRSPRIKKYGTDKILCEICFCYFQRRIKAQHLRTKKHQWNLLNKYIT